jgi:hypothetical protein
LDLHPALPGRSRGDAFLLGLNLHAQQIEEHKVFAQQHTVGIGRFEPAQMAQPPDAEKITALRQSQFVLSVEQCVDAIANARAQS